MIAPPLCRLPIAEMTSVSSPAGALVLFSGGQDSTTCLAWALDRYERVDTIGFNYGQRHAAELEARLRILSRIGAISPRWEARLGADHVLDIQSFGSIGETAMTQARAIEMTDRGYPSTFVPGRNLVFFTYAAAVADRRGLTDLVGGMGEADYSGYPDCRRTTLDALETALTLGVDRPLRIVTPLMNLSKAGVWALAASLGGEPLVDLIVEDSHTCYLGARDRVGPGGRGCGRCPACQLREGGYLEFRERSAQG